MPTPVTSATPYCSAEQLLQSCDWRVVADWAADPASPDDPRPTRAQLLDDTSTPGAVVARFLALASADVEQACYARGHYTPDDLAALTGNALAGLEGLVAGLALWRLAQRRNPMSADPEKVPGAKAAMDQLEALRNGAKIFPLQDQADAGAGMAAVTFVDVTAPGRTVGVARRFFGPRGT